MAVSISEHQAVLSPEQLLTSFASVEYRPAFLLSPDLDRVIVGTDDYRRATQHGFESYFEEMYQDDPTNEAEMIFVPHLHTRREMLAAILETMRDYSPPFRRPLLAWRVGFVVGWLSAFAIADPENARVGIHFLQQCILFELDIEPEGRTYTHSN